MQRPASIRTTLIPVAVVFLAFLAASASGQSVTGSIVGKVVDVSQAVMPGVTVTAASPSLIRGTQTVVTDTDGTYRIVNLPPGTYSVTVELQGFDTIKRDAVIVQSNRAVAVDFQLTVGAIRETITVTGVAPLVDVRNTRVGTNVDQTSLLNLPTGRSFSDILNIQPGVNESAYTFAPVNSVQGSNVRANYYSMDGFQMQDTAVGYFIGEIDYDSLQEVQVTTGGISAEFGQASGGVFNFITKSGGNDFKGGGRIYINNESLNSSNITDDLRRRGVTSPSSIKSRYNESVDLGGPIRRNKVWFYADFGRTDYTQSVPALAGIVDPTYGGWTDIVKLTWQATTSNQITGSHQSRHDHWVPANADSTIIADHGSYIYNTRNQTNYLLKWSGTFRSKLLVEAKYSENRGGGSDTETFPNADPNKAGYLDQARNLDYGWWRSDRVNKLRDAKVFKSDVTYYLQSGMGTHDLKGGFEQERDPFREVLHYPESMQQILLNSAPFQVVLYNEPINDARQVTRYSLYLQDQWTTKSDVTLNVGVRYDHSEGWTPEQTFGVSVDGASGTYPNGKWFPGVTFGPAHDIVTPVGVAPRVGITWDVGGKHTWVAKANYGRWYDRLISVPSASGGSATYGWNDKNGNGHFEDGEQGALVSTSVITNPVWDPSQFVDAKRKNPYTDSYQAGLEWEVYKNVAVAVTGTVKRDRDLIGSISQTVPYSYYTTTTVKNPLDGQLLTLSLLDPQYRNITRVNWSTTLPQLKRDYKGIEFVFKKRFDGKTQFQVSSDIGRATGNVGTSFLASTNFANPNAFINADGPTDLDATVVLKAQGTYAAPWGFMLSGSYLFNSGFPMDIANTSGPPGSRLVRFFRGVDYPATAVEPFIDVPAEPRGSRRQDAQHLLSVRVEKKLDLGNQHRVGLVLDVFNLFNRAPVINVQSLRTDAPNFLRPETIAQPRTARVGIRYDF
jgi:outer membrane receptor protein involved in Fe transport